MPDYLPKHAPGDSVTRIASGAITGGDVVVVSGPKTVARSAGADVKFLGVAAHDAVVGQEVTVFKGGIQRPKASGAITAGDQVTTAANGRVITSGAPAAGTQVGIAQTTAADGQQVDVDFNR